MPAAAVTADLPTVDLKGIPFLRPGIWNNDTYSDADLDDLVADTNELIAKGIYTPRLKIGHSEEQKLAADEMPADGGVTRLYRRGRDVLADIKGVPAKLAKLIRAGAFPQRSAEIWINGATFEGKNYRKPLKNLSLLGVTVPAVSSLDDIAARYASGQPATGNAAPVATYSDDRGTVATALFTAEPAVPKPERQRTPAKPAANLADNTPSVPVADDGSHAPVTETHSHHHPDYGAGDNDDGDGSADNAADDGQHTHVHTHDGDANHAPARDGHSHSVNMAAIAEKEGAPKSPPKGYPTDPSDYGDPKNFKYPIDKGHIGAWAYFNHPGMQSKGGYTGAEWATIGRRIAAAANKLIGPGHSFKDGKIQTAATAQNARQLALGDMTWSADEVRMAVQDALQMHFPRVYSSDGMAPSGVTADGPSPDIRDVYGDGSDGDSYVVVWDQDSDELWSLPFTCDPATGDCDLGAPTKVRVQYAPIGNGTAAYAQSQEQLPHDPGRPAYDRTSPRTSDMADRNKQNTPAAPDDGSADDGADGYAAIEQHLAAVADGIAAIKGRNGVGAVRSLHSLLTKQLASMRGQWPDIDTAGNTDGSEGPEGENKQEQQAGGAHDPPHGPPTRSLAQEDDMAEAAVLARLEEYERRDTERNKRIAELERRELERADRDQARIAELERIEAERDAKEAVEAAVRNHKLTPKMKEVGLRMYASDKETFAALLSVAPDAWHEGEQGSAGTVPDPATKEPTKEEVTVAERMQIDPARVAAARSGGSLWEKRAERRAAAAAK